MKVAKTRESFPIYFILEAAVNPEDIKTEILRENTIQTATGEKVKTITTDSTLQSFDIINWNKRIYPALVVMDGLDTNPMIQNDIRMKQWAGEYGHPDSTDMARQSQIKPDMTSHFIDNYRREGNLLKGHVTSAPCGYGLDIYNLAMAGRPWAFSLRAFGGVDSNNTAIRPLRVITYDFVNRPSHKEAYSNLSNIVETAFTESFLSECSQTTLIEAQNIEREIREFTLNKSDNLKIAKELFNLHESTAKIDGKNNVILEGSYMGDSIKVYVPIESFVKENYRKLLNF